MHRSLFHTTSIAVQKLSNIVHSQATHWFLDTHSGSSKYHICIYIYISNFFCKDLFNILHISTAFCTSVSLKMSDTQKLYIWGQQRVQHCLISSIKHFQDVASSSSNSFNFAICDFPSHLDPNHSYGSV